MIPKQSLLRFQRRYQPTHRNAASFTKIYTARINSPIWTFFIAERSGKILGYHFAKHVGGTVVLRGLFVDPRYQSAGIGRRLLQTMIAHADGHRIELKVLADNARAIHLYESIGFVKTRRPVGRFFDAAQILMVQKGQG